MKRSTWDDVTIFVSDVDQHRSARPMLCQGVWRRDCCNPPADAQLLPTRKHHGELMGIHQFHGVLTMTSYSHWNWNWNIWWGDIDILDFWVCRYIYIYKYTYIDTYIYIYTHLYIIYILWIDTANNNMITWIYLKMGYTWVYSITQIYTKYTRAKKMMTVTNQFRGNLLSKRVAGCGSALFHKFWSSHTFWKMIECIEKKREGGGVVSAIFLHFWHFISAKDTKPCSFQNQTLLLK